MTTIATQQPKFWDLVGGGTYTVAANTTVNPTSTEEWTINIPTTYGDLTVFGGDLNLTSSAVDLTSATLSIDSNSSIGYTAPRTLERWIHAPAAHVWTVSDQGSGGVADWSYGGVLGAGSVLTARVTQAYVNTGSATQPVVSFDVTPFLLEGDITAVEVFVDPAGAAAAPAVLPLWELWRIYSSGDTLIETMTDPGGGSYRTGHGIAKVLGTPYTFNPNGTGETVYLALRGEASTNATAGLTVKYIKITQTVSRIDHF